MRVILLVALSFCGAVLAAPESSKPAHFYAAAGKAEITPDLSRESIRLAGYGATGRRAKGVHDPLYARAVVVSDGDRTVALVAVDSIGLFREDVLDIRRRLGWEGNREYLFVAATHDHSAPDTLGLWGPFIGISGVDKRYQRRLKDCVVRLVQDLTGRLEEAELAAASKRVDPSGLCTDSRDPAVIDPELETVQLRSKRDPKRVLATVVRWSCHPEVLGADNLFVTADYPGQLCARIEEKTGGACVFFSGAIGGLLTPDVGLSSQGIEQRFAESKRIGTRIADLALEALSPRAALGPGEVARTVRAEDGLRTENDLRTAGRVYFASRTVRIPVENSRYLLFLPTLAFGHRIMDGQGRLLPRWKPWWIALRHLLFFPIPEDRLPWVETEIAYVRLGPVEILGIPGELFPELAIGGYGGDYRFGHPLIRPTNPNPPALPLAQEGPYLRQRLKSKYGLLVGLANDELGYIIPDYDFKIRSNRSMTPRLPGHHYEETNSIGRRATGLLLRAYADLLKEGS